MRYILIYYRAADRLVGDIRPNAHRAPTFDAEEHDSSAIARLATRPRFNAHSHGRKAVDFSIFLDRAEEAETLNACAHSASRSKWRLLNGRIDLSGGKRERQGSLRARLLIWTFISADV